MSKYIKVGAVQYLNFISNNYSKIVRTVENVDMDVYHDAILKMYDEYQKGKEFEISTVQKNIIAQYHNLTKKNIQRSYIYKCYEDSFLDFAGNISENKEPGPLIKGIKEKSMMLLNKVEYQILDMYYFQKKTLSVISIFTGMSVNEINKVRKQISTKLQNKLNYENYQSTAN